MVVFFVIGDSEGQNTIGKQGKCLSN